MELNSFRSRKFILSSFVLLVSAIGLFTGKVDDGAWIGASSLCLGLYGASNVISKKVERDGLHETNPERDK